MTGPCEELAGSPSGRGDLCMKKLLVLVLLGAGAVGAALYLRSASPKDGPPRQPAVARARSAARPAAPVKVLPRHGRRRAEWEAYKFQLQRGPRARGYNLPAVVEAATGAKPNVRLLLDVQDAASYYFVELTAQGCRIGKVESGLELAIGTQAAEGLRPGIRNKVIVKRRPNTFEVVLNNAVVAWAEDEAFRGGQIGAGVLNGSAHVRLDRPQRWEEAYLADDFMKGQTETGAWATVSGRWRVATLEHASLSSNAFYFVGSTRQGGPAATAVRGQWFWDDYRVRVAAASFERGDVGIYFYYRDEDNWFLFRWNAARQAGGRRGRVQLVKRWRGKESVLAEAPGGYEPTVWYDLAVEVVGRRVRAFVDDRQLLAATDPNLCFGKVGLYTATTGYSGARFDDVLVQGVSSFEDDFSTAVAGRWRALRGTWTDGETAHGPARLVSAHEPAKLVAGSQDWRDYRLAAAVHLPPKLRAASEVGLVGHYLDEMNHAIFAWRPAEGSARLEASVDGTLAVAQSAPAPRGLPDTRHRLELAWRANVVTAKVDGRAVASAWVPTLDRGKVGLYAAAVERAAFDHARVIIPGPPEPVLSTNKVFSKELSMEIWAGAASDWETTAERVDGAHLRPHWHRASFFGDATIEVELDGATDPPSAGTRACHLVLSADSAPGRTKPSLATGYRFALSWPKPGEPRTAYRAALWRGPRGVAQAQVRLAAAPRRLRFDRLGQHLIASVDNRQILAHRDDRPLRGIRAAYATENLAVPWKHAKVFSETVQVYTFGRASSNWRPAAGDWAVSNRWQCDPRWSFFSGSPDGSPLAALWNKNLCEGDVSVEFAVGPKMDRARGSRYEYARDFNVTICADGRDLTSGYSFVLGGWGNRRTAIVRRGTIVARSSRVLSTSKSMHRRWLYIKVQKRGRRLAYWVDGDLVLTYTDPRPLPGRHVAIWSWDCAIMVARVRISGERLAGREPPGTPRGPCKSIYSMR